jgi:hypothetical protein
MMKIFALALALVVGGSVVGGCDRTKAEKKVEIKREDGSVSTEKQVKTEDDKGNTSYTHERHEKPADVDR